MYTVDQLQEIMSLRAKGFSIRRITQETGASKNLVSKVIGENRERINTLRTIELEEYLEEQKLSKEQRISSLGAVLKLSQDSLIERLEKKQTDLTDYQLFKVYIETLRTLKEETVLPEITTPEESAILKVERESALDFNMKSRRISTVTDEYEDEKGD